MHDVLVTGGTGVLGRAVAEVLLKAGHGVRALSRQASPKVPEGAETVTGDVETGLGIARAIEGVDTIVHCATSARKHRQVDVEGTRALVRAAAKAGEIHFLVVSIVGCDALSFQYGPLGYYRSKALAELAVTESGLPWTVLRATQFHDLLFALVYGLTRLPIVPVPSGVRDQPIDVHDVAQRVGELVDAGPSGRAEDIGGPEVLTLDEAVRIVQQAAGTAKRTARFALPGRTFAGFRTGRHLTPAHRAGTRTFAEYVAAHVHRDDGVSGVARFDVPYRWRGR